MLQSYKLCNCFGYIFVIGKKPPDPANRSMVAWWKLVNDQNLGEMGSDIKKYSTNFLLGRNSALIGAGANINLFGDYFEYNYSKNGFEADKIALENDWGVVGQDLKSAIDKYEKEKTPA